MPGIREPLPALCKEEATTGDRGDLLCELGHPLASADGLVFFAVVIALVLTLVQIGEFSWIAGV